MDTKNPTALPVGAKGSLYDISLRVAGRVVLGMEEAGETYYWNEFNLVDDAGKSATLVFEETENGPEWKLFRRYEPLHPLTVAEAAQKRAGDQVSLDGEPRTITLVDQSRVYHIEGVAPEGVEVGDVADYFNVDSGDIMLVASWTGGEIEFYKGCAIPAEAVAKAFALPAPSPAVPPLLSSGANDSQPEAIGISPRGILKILGLVAVLGVAYCNWQGPAELSPAAKRAAPPARVTTGSTGILGGTHYEVTSHAMVEIARMGARWDRHEYKLHGDHGEDALLVQALNGDPHEWHLLRPQPPPDRFGPYEAAALRTGAGVAGDPSMRITVLFQSQRRSLDGRRPPGPWPDSVQYGFVATGGGQWLVARWTETELQLHRGTRLPEAAVLAALIPRPERGK